MKYDNFIRKIRRNLEKQGLYLRTSRDVCGCSDYYIIDINNIVQSGEHMSLDAVAAWAGISIEEFDEEGAGE